MAATLPDLPVRTVLPSLRAALTERYSAVLTAPPGSGKTTVLPLALLGEPWLAGRRIVMLEPRRLATRAAAARMAELLGEEVGETVGYQIRFDRRLSAATRIEVVTEGILTRRLQDDPGLDGVGLVIFDEFHERSLHADLALALTLNARELLRPDLRLLVMSATLDTGAVARLLDDPPVITASGREYPVEIVHVADRGRRPAAADFTVAGVTVSVAGAVRRALAEHSGDILVFLPGIVTIRRMQEELADLVRQGILVCPLAGDLSIEMQRRAILPDPGGRRRVVLATAIAETSLTIEGVRVVIDSGWTRRPRFDPQSGLSGLETVRVSRMAATQRAGRAGRLGPGVCYRLWSREEEALLPVASVPEILQADLAGLALDLARWGTDGHDLRWLDPPPAGALAQGRELLRRLGVLDGEGRLTDFGRAVAAVGLHPRLAAMLVVGRRQGCGRLAADLAALLSERDILPAGHAVGVDIEARLAVLAGFRRGRLPNGRSTRGGDAARIRAVDRLARQLDPATDEPAFCQAGMLLAAAYPDRIAMRRDGRHGIYLLSIGRAAGLPAGDPLAAADFLVAARIDAGGRQGRIHLAAAVDRVDLERVLGETIEERQEYRLVGGRVEAVAQRCLGAVVLERRVLAEVDEDRVLELLLAAVRERGSDCLPWDRASRRLQARIRFLRRVFPDLGVPDVSDEGLLDRLEDWLAPWLVGKRSLDALRRIDMHEVLLTNLPWPLRRQLDDLVPDRIRLPSGVRRKVDYPADGPPVLAVRIQELFGCRETPTVCGGRVKVLLHLLSPAGRPVQVTSDLENFWKNSYFDVKKELAGRYPKHHWPDDPLTARPGGRR